ncbi:uncharacterized protein I206_102255 [Kwoniella pini CBS 10737]|uniref:Uncharacterized protein n=1 Tax=Kwoniella pini CBS 10737 TaxID=1296096 RepID=A0A1B9HT08_9TREE|nr:uncharacterized protein I206_07625 [Kwoniella pini CBS 10737]OCF46391.1 hypothetical protein I206_07625 [Kwoniella pini CBS 10737]
MDIDKSFAPPPPRPKRTIKRCLCIFCVLIAAGLGLVISFFIIEFTKTTIQAVRDPHKSLIYNGTITPDLTSSSVVKPLIDGETKFDILFTVYSRIPNEEVPNEKQRQEYYDEKNYNPEEYTARELSLSPRTGRSPIEIRYMPIEKVIYQGIIMKDLTLAHRDIETNVKFELPLKRFYDYYLYNPDVRGAVTLLPQQPSKLDRMEDYTHWKPEEVELPKRIHPEFINSISSSDNGDDSKKWAALEHISHGFSLIEFHNHGDPCKNSSDTTKDDVDDIEDDLYASIKEDEEKLEQSHIDPVNVIEKEQNIKSQNITGPIISPGSQPYLVSRTHVYIVNETRLFERKAFDKAHKDLRKNACGKSLLSGWTSRFLCTREYATNGHWENRFVLQPEEGKKSKELAYGPYLGNLIHAAGPKDVRPLPITRNNCSNSIEVDPEFISVNFTIKFSSLKPGRINVLNNFVQTYRSNHNSTKWELENDHNEWEQLNGIFGSRTNGKHPKTRLFLTTIKTLLAFPIIILELIYWYTRQTSNGLNFFSIYFKSIGILLTSLIGLINNWKNENENKNWLNSLIFLFFLIFEISPAILQLRIIFPFEIKKIGWFKFNFKRWKWSHSERNSIRKGTGINKFIWIVVFISLFLIIYIPNIYKLNLINPKIIQEFSNYNQIKNQKNDLFLWNNSIISSFLNCFELFSLLIQIFHNKNLKTFAGNFSLNCYFILIFRFLDLFYYLPFIIGKYDLNFGLSYIFLIEFFIEIFFVYQAWNYPKINQKLNDENED